MEKELTLKTYPYEPSPLKDNCCMCDNPITGNCISNPFCLNDIIIYLFLCHPCSLEFYKVRYDYTVLFPDKIIFKLKEQEDIPVLPTRIQRSRQHKQISPNGLPVKYVGRPTKFGNPFKVGEEIPKELLKKMNKMDRLFYGEGYAVSSNYAAVELFERYIITDEFKELVKSELKGKNLSCWCGNSNICHADTLLKIANS